MASFKTLLTQLALATLAHSHGVILNAQGDDGSPASIGFQVDPAVARNCTTINPCQQDATIIRDAEITANIVNQCGRTELSGNIDVGENTENALAAGQVTQVKSGSKITVTIHQVNADGAGPYACDLDETSNTGTITQNLTVTNNVPGTNGFSQAKAQAFNITVQMPDNFTCTGASTGNVCTVRCRNNALAGPFGGCFAVQQTDTKEKTNVANSIPTIQQLKPVLDQVQQNQADFKLAVEANQNAGSGEAAQNRAAVDALLGNTIVTRSFAQETPTVVQGNPQATEAATTAAGDAATTPAAGDAATTADAGSGDVVTSVITPSAAATTEATRGRNRGGRNRNNQNNQQQNNNQQQQGNNQQQQNNNQQQNNAANGGRNNNAVGNDNEARGLRWAKRMVSYKRSE